MPTDAQYTQSAVQLVTGSQGHCAQLDIATSGQYMLIYITNSATREDCV